MTRHERAAKAVFPKNYWIHAPDLFGEHLHERAGQSDFFHASQTERNYCTTQRVHNMPPAEQRRIGELQALHGKRFVVRNHIDDFLRF